MNRAARDLGWVFTAAVALAALIGALGVVDSRRAQAELSRLESDLCDRPLPPRLLLPLDRLFDRARRRETDAAALLERLEGKLPTGDRHLDLYFESESMLWSVDRWSREARPSGAFSWPQPLARWEEVAWSTGCRGVRAGSRLIAARTVRTPKGRFAVLVAERSRN